MPPERTTSSDIHTISLMTRWLGSLWHWNLPYWTGYTFIATNNVAMISIWVARNITMRKTSILRDRWYMACNRAIIMACMICQSSQCHWDPGTADSLTTQHGIWGNFYPTDYYHRDCAWNNISYDPWRILQTHSCWIIKLNQQAGSITSLTPI